MYQKGLRRNFSEIAKESGTLPGLPHRVDGPPAASVNPRPGMKQAGSYGPCPTCPQPTFSLWKNLQQGISLVREVKRKQRKHRKTVQQDLSDNTAVRHSQRPLDTTTSTQVEEANCMLSRLQP